MAIRVNGGIINSQTLTGSLRFFKLTGPFAWTISDGTVNLNEVMVGGSTTTSTYFSVGKDAPVPQSAAEHILRLVADKASIVAIAVIGNYGATTELHIAVSASAFGWGEGDDGVDAATEIKSRINELEEITVPASVGSLNQALPPATAVVDLSTVTIVEVPFTLA